MTTYMPLAGVWSRQWEEDPLTIRSPGVDAGGNDDTTSSAPAKLDRETLVLWTQAKTSGIYVDLRLPLHSPGRTTPHNPTPPPGIEPRPAALCADGCMAQGAAKILLSPTSAYKELLLRTKSFAGVMRYSADGAAVPQAALQSDSVLRQLVELQQREPQDPSTPSVPLCTCFWQRSIDYQPPSGTLDEGVCISEPEPPPRSPTVPPDPSTPALSPPHEGRDSKGVNVGDGSIQLRETGANGSYAEGWLRLAGTHAGPFMALELCSERGAGAVEQHRKGYWVRAGNRFAYAVGRPMHTTHASWEVDCSDCWCWVHHSTGRTLKQLVEEMNEDETVIQLLTSYICATGEIDEEEKWIIQNATNPELLGCQLVGSGDDKLCCSTLREKKEQPHHAEQLLRLPSSGLPVTRTWKVMELAGCTLPLF